MASALWLPWLLAQGMFMDGVYDALFAHNLAQGISTFWAPQTIYYSRPAYWDNPPLSMFFLSLWYKVLGDHYRVERLYSLTCALVQMALLFALWKNYFKGRSEVQKFAWLPMLLWLVSPITGWSYSNNMMENTMSIFTTAAILSWVLWLRRQRYILWYAALSGLLIFLATITKGPVGLFPLAAPVFFLCSGENLNSRQVLQFVAIQLVVFAAVFAAVFSTHSAQHFLQQYLEVQLLPAVNPSKKAGLPNFTIFADMLRMLAPMLALGFVAVVSFGQQKHRASKNLYLAALAFLGIGLSASVPIALSAKQHHYYLLPSLPLFAVGFGCLLVPLMLWVEEKLQPIARKNAEHATKLCALAVVVVCLVLCIVNRHGFARDQQLLTDLARVKELVGDDKLIRSDWDFYGQWSLRGYLNRLYDIKLCMPDEPAPARYYITAPKGWGNDLPPESNKVFSGGMFDLYQMPAP